MKLTLTLTILVGKDDRTRDEKCLDGIILSIATLCSTRRKALACVKASDLTTTRMTRDYMLESNTNAGGGCTVPISYSFNHQL